VAASPPQPTPSTDLSSATHPLWGLVTVLAAIAERIERSHNAEQSGNEFDVRAEQVGDSERAA
jgi:hypothetical protein